MGKIIAQPKPELPLRTGSNLAGARFREATAGKRLSLPGCWDGSLLLQLAAGSTPPPALPPPPSSRAESLMQRARCPPSLSRDHRRQRSRAEPTASAGQPAINAPSLIYPILPPPPLSTAATSATAESILTISGLNHRPARGRERERKNIQRARNRAEEGGVEITKSEDTEPLPRGGGYSASRHTPPRAFSSRPRATVRNAPASAAAADMGRSRPPSPSRRMVASASCIPRIPRGSQSVGALSDSWCAPRVAVPRSAGRARAALSAGARTASRDRDPCVRVH